jgi:hypothetical protein
MPGDVRGAEGRVGLVGGGVAAVDEAELDLVVADPELDVAQPHGGVALGAAVHAERSRSAGLALVGAEVRLDAQQLGVPPRGRVQVLGGEADCAHPSEHDRSFPGS